jgi:hypothetical protein
MAGFESVPGAWLLLAGTSQRRIGGEHEYDDRPGSEYSWDSEVYNSGKVAPGDLVVLWDGKQLLGASVVSKVVESPGTKTKLTCPSCGVASIKSRSTLKPAFKCEKCATEFDQPATTVVEVIQYRTEHGDRWVDLFGMLSAAELRQTAVSPKSQHSIRPLDWAKFSAAIGGSKLWPGESIGRVLRPVDSHGHKVVEARARLGQDQFRANLLTKFGSVCAISGPTPPQALDACHLYSYAELAVHLDGGGLLLRTDVHRLFDLGLISINPSSKKVWVSEVVRSSPSYSGLHGGAAHVALGKRELKWLRLHWAQHVTTD